MTKRGWLMVAFACTLAFGTLAQANRETGIGILQLGVRSCNNTFIGDRCAPALRYPHVPGYV